MGLRYQRRRELGRGLFITVGNRGPRIGARRGRLTVSAGATGLSLAVRILRGLSYRSK
jgi:hypothetical protein